MEQRIYLHVDLFDMKSNIIMINNSVQYRYFVQCLTDKNSTLVWLFLLVFVPASVYFSIFVIDDNLNVKKILWIFVNKYFSSVASKTPDGNYRPLTFTSFLSSVSPRRGRHYTDITSSSDTSENSDSVRFQSGSK